MAKITKIWAREILDSRATPTIEAACQLDSRAVSVFSVPSGASTGTYEALELRDGDLTRYYGKGTLKAVSNVNTIIGPALVSAQMDPSNQEHVDNMLKQLDGSENKSKLGANSILAVSGVIAKAGAIANNKSLFDWVKTLADQKGIKFDNLKIPTPLFNMINGGLHGAGNLDFQEFHVIPATTKSFADGLRLGGEIYMKLGQTLANRGAIHSVGDGGGYAPNLFTNADALEILVEAIATSNYRIGIDLFLGLDVAANSFYKDGGYVIRDKSSALTETALIQYYKDLNNQYHLALLEDPLHEDSWNGWAILKKALGDQMAIVGDDLLVTNPRRVQKAIETAACNTVLVKPNQIGTITETLDVIKIARSAGLKILVSHRSGETNESFIADFAVGVGADFVKFGAPARGERVAKYNRLSSIEMELTYRSQPSAPQQ